MDTTVDSKAERVEAPERIWVDVRESDTDYDPGCNAQWMPAGSWKPEDDGEKESDWVLYVRTGTPSGARQRAEQAAVTVAERARRREMADIIAAEHRRRKLVKVIMSTEKERVGKLSDDKLIERFVTTVLNGLPTGSYEEALAEELVDRFSAVMGIEAR